LPIAELACAGCSAAPKKTKQDIVDRQSRATGQGKIKKFFGSAETAKNGFVH
jgi:hypothetical protein